jgi:hypothetical protein
MKVISMHNFISSSGSGIVINYGSGSDFLTSCGSGSVSTSQKVTVRFRFRFHNTGSGYGTPALVFCGIPPVSLLIFNNITGIP